MSKSEGPFSRSVLRAFCTLSPWGSELMLSIDFARAYAPRNETAPGLDLDLALKRLVTGESAVLDGKQIAQAREGPARLNGAGPRFRPVDRTGVLDLGSLAGHVPGFDRQ